MSLLIGLGFLILCMALREGALSYTQTAVLRIVGEGLLILGWVAMWGPLEVFLYGWWLIVGRRRILERLAVVDVELVPRAAAPGLGAAPSKS